ncbi:MAG: hypothetical protein AAB533_03585, partial [Patescibacteria group bacterium]
MRFSFKPSAAVNMALILAAAAAAVGATRMTRDTLALRAEVRDAERYLDAIAAHKEELTRRREAADAPESVEYEAKAKWNLKNPGEEVVVV